MLEQGKCVILSPSSQRREKGVNWIFSIIRTGKMLYPSPPPHKEERRMDRLPPCVNWIFSILWNNEIATTCIYKLILQEHIYFLKFLPTYLTYLKNGAFIETSKFFYFALLRNKVVAGFRILDLQMICHDSCIFHFPSIYF